MVVQIFFFRYVDSEGIVLCLLVKFKAVSPKLLQCIAAADLALTFRTCLVTNYPKRLPTIDFHFTPSIIAFEK